MSVNLQYISDLHLEFPENEKFIKDNPLTPKGEILIIAGDLVCFSKQTRVNDFINWCSDNFAKTYFLPGNHEWYNYNIDDKPFYLHEKIKDNFHLVNNVKIKYKDVDLIFSTLWTRIHPMNEAIISSRMNDFSVIKKGNRLFTPSDCTDLHEKSLSFIKEAVSSSGDNKKMVISHHVPTFMNYPKKYAGDIINECFAVELFDFIEESNIDYWQYAHNHYNHEPFKIGNTTLVTNQLGYVKYGENKSFRRDAIISL